MANNENVEAWNRQRVQPGTVQDVLTSQGVFKGASGLDGLLNADEFWDQQPYGTRLYYGDGIADYLHRDVLRATMTRSDA